MWQVVVTDVAEEDLLAAYSYISEILKVPVAAENLLLEAERAIGSLAGFPFSCPIVDDVHFARKGVRFLPIRNYLAFYTADELTQTVTIIRFLYARRDWVTLLEKGKAESNEVTFNED